MSIVSGVSTRLAALSPRFADSADAASDTDLLRQALDEAFAALADVLAAADTGMLSEAIPAVDRCRAELAAQAPARVVQPLAAACFEAARTIALSRATERRAQVAELVTMVRDTVAAIGGDQAQMHDALTGSAARFEQLARTNDLQQIQAQLATEVAMLKRVTMERRAAWERAAQEFGTRLSTLETQLDRTRREAAVDPLTSVPNRRTFERTCREWLKPNRSGFVMALVDVDNFKAINDQYGHAVGDRVLVGVAQALAKSLRAEDLVARLGGDEFAILVAGLPLPQAEGRFAAIGRAVQNACRPLVQDGTAPSISIGLAECSAGDTFDSLHQRADAALYQAKRGGKGRVAAKASPLLRDLRGDGGKRAGR